MGTNEGSGRRLEVGALEERRVLRACLLLQGGDRYQLIIVQEPGGGFAVAHCARIDEVTEARALSRDGTRFAFFTRPLDALCKFLVVRTLADGTELRFDAVTDDAFDLLAAFAPNGAHLAVLSDGPEGEQVTVSILDLPGGERRRLWTGQGGATPVGMLSWSPDGRFIAAGFENDDEDPVTVILDVAGQFAPRALLRRDDRLGQEDFVPSRCSPCGASGPRRGRRARRWRRR